MRSLIWLAFLCSALSSTALQTPKQGCVETPRLRPDGTTEFVDCHNKITPAKPIAAQKPEPPTAATTAESTTVMPDPIAAKAYYDSIAAHFRFDTDAYAHATKVFEWQHTSSIIIFWMVIALVLAGLTLATIQFRIAMKAHLAQMYWASTKKAAKVEAQVPQVPSAQASDDSNTTEVELSLHGIKISSSVIGLIILAMSMAFFYLYLKFVYPIETVSGH